MSALKTLDRKCMESRGANMRSPDGKFMDGRVQLGCFPDFLRRPTPPSADNTLKRQMRSGEQGRAEQGRAEQS